MVLALLAQWQLVEWLAQDRKLRRAWRWAGGVWIFLGFAFGIPVIHQQLPYWSWLIWLLGMGFGYAMIIVGMWLIQMASRNLAPSFDPGRRLALAAPVAFLGYGAFVERNHFRLSEVSIPIPGLPRDLDGLKLVQLTDIHYSPYLTAKDLNYAIDMANATRAHIAFVTGDFITMRPDPLEECIRLLARLKADSGVLGCLGNHEIVARCQDYAAGQCARQGIRILRQQAEQLRFGEATINFAGVDYQRMGSRYLLDTEQLVKPGTVNILLSHNPDVFPVAAQMGYDLTMAGHTHGGQVTVEILQQYLNVARFFTPYIHGVYEKNGKSVYVSRGLGTVGVPARVGAPPEVSLIKLCAI
jgi:hypothetical protein